MDYKITYIGHATCLIQLGGETFLTDPNFSQKIWPKRRRLQKPGVKPDQLPPLSAILISHSSYDHLDIFSLKYFKTTTPIITPRGVSRFVRKFFPGPVTALKMGAFHHQGRITVHGLPLVKQGFRLLPLRYSASLGYLLEGENTCIYFAGDTGYGTHFKETGKKFKIDVALLPIQHKRSRGPYSSIGPEQALQAFQDLGAKTMIPIRWDAFQMGKEKPETYLAKLKSLAQQKGIENQIKILKPGEIYSGK